MESELSKSHHEPGKNNNCAWRRLEHVSTTLGMATFFSIFVNVSIAIYLRNVDLFSRADGNVKLDGIKLFRNFFGPVFAIGVISSLLHFNMTSTQSSKLWSFGIQILASRVTVFLLVHIIVAASAIDVHWSCISVLAYLGCVFALSFTYRRYRVLAHPRGRKKTRKILSVKLRYFLRFFIPSVYILVVMPLYAASSSPVRVVIIALVHPFLVHGYFTYARLSDLLAAPSSHYIHKVSAKHATGLGLMAMGRRLMLVLMTSDAQSALFAILISLIEDLFLRCFLVDVDQFILRQLNVDDVKSEAFVNIQRAVWMTHENMASISELAAIISAPVFYIVLGSQSLAINLGYEASDAANLTPILFVHLLLQLCGEIFVGYVATWVKMERGIQVVEYFYKSFSFQTQLQWTCSGIMSTLLALYGFIRHANIFFCASSHPCDCLHLPHIGERYNISCAIDSSLTNITLVEADWLLEGVDSSIFGISLLTGLGMFSVIGLSVVIARNRRKSKVIDDLERKEEALKNAFSKEMQALVNEAMEKEQTKEMWAYLEAYKVPRDHITLESSIGQGSFGEVWRGNCRGKTVAVKQLLSDSVDAHVANAFRKECNLMALLQKDGISHENLIQMLFCCWDRELLMLIEFCELGTVNDALSLNATADNHDDTLWFTMAYGITRGMEYMHSREPMIIHRDLKPENVLVQGSKSSSPKEWVAKIADFGESREFQQGDNLTMVGTPYFCCPEIVMCEEYDEKADVYSFGVLLFHIVSFGEGGIGKARWGGKRFSQVNVVKGIRPDIPKEFQPWLIDIISLCWSGRSRERPSFQTISSVLDERRNNAYENKAQVTKLRERAPTFEGDAFMKMQPAAENDNDTSVKGDKSGIESEIYARVTLLHEDVFEKPFNGKGDSGLSKRGERAILLAKMLGYSVILSLIIIFVVAIWSNISKLTKDRFTTQDGVVVEEFPVYDSSGDIIHFLVPILIFYGLSSAGNVGSANQALYLSSGPKYALVPFFLTLLLPPIFYLIAISLPSTFDMKYNFSLYWLGVLYIIVFIILEIFIRAKCSNVGLKSSSTRNCEDGAKDTQSQLTQTKQSNNKAPSLVATIVPVTNIIVLIVFCLGYLVYILPIYFSADTSMRMIICLIVHPIAVECNEVLNRISQIFLVKDKDIDIAKEKVLSEAQISISSKFFLSYCRRFMLLNLGDASSTMITIVFTSMEEAVMRAFLIEIDTWVRKGMGKPPLEGRSLELQRLVWSIDINQSSIAEFVAIIVSTFAYILLEPHALVVNLGYKHGEALLGGLVFVQLLLELLLESMVDTAALWAESEHSIPIDAYFRNTNSIFVWTLHIFSSLSTLIACISAFVRYPNIITCDSNFICDCIDQPVYFEWYNETCASLPENITINFITNASHAHKVHANATSLDGDDRGSVLADMDVGSIFTTIVTFIGAVSFVYLFVAYNRYRKNIKRVSIVKKRMEQLDTAFDAEFQKVVERILAIDDNDVSSKELDAYKIPRDHAALIERIGRGAHGEVWVGSANGATVAIKKVYVDGEDDVASINRFRSECLIMAKLQTGGVAHPNIVQMMYCCWKGSLMLMLEYYELGSLCETLHVCKQNPMAFGERVSWVCEGEEGVLLKLVIGVCKGMQHIHAHGIVHLDLKPDNILIDAKHDALPSKWNARISDFGVATESSKPIPSNMQLGTSLYVSPEMLSSDRVGAPADVYSFAMTLLDIAATIEGSSLAEQWDGGFQSKATKYSNPGLIASNRPHLTPMLLPGQHLANLGEIIEVCWTHEPSHRPTFEEIERRLARVLQPSS